MRDRLASIRPSRLVACFCLPANLISRIACALISFWPVSQPRIDFWNVLPVYGWRALFWTQFCNKLVAFVCQCLLSNHLSKFLWVKVIWRIKTKLKLHLIVNGSLDLLFLFVVSTSSYSVLSNPFPHLSNLSLPVLLFPLLLFIPPVPTMSDFVCWIQQIWDGRLGIGDTGVCLTVPVVH